MISSIPRSGNSRITSLFIIIYCTWGDNIFIFREGSFRKWPSIYSRGYGEISQIYIRTRNRYAASSAISDTVYDFFSQFSHVSFKKVLLHTQDNKISNWLDETVLPESYNLYNRVLWNEKKVFSNKVLLYQAAVDFVRVN